MGAIQLANGKIAEADQTYRQIAALPQKQYRLAYATFLAKQKRTEDAARELERLLRAGPDDRLARSELVAIYVTTNRRSDAGRILNDALKKNSKDTEALVQRSQIYLQDGSYEAAQSDIEQILRTDPGSVQAHFLLAKVRRGLGDLSGAKVELGRTLEVAPEFFASPPGTRQCPADCRTALKRRCRH